MATTEDALRLEHEHFTGELRRVEDELRQELRRELEAAVGAHRREHDALGGTLEKAERTLDKRLEGMNQFRDQLREQAARFVTLNQHDQLIADINRRFEEQRIRHDTDVGARVRERVEVTDSLRARVEAIEKLDVKSEGKGMGQASTIAAILAGLAAIGSLLSIVTLLMHLFATGQP